MSRATPQRNLKNADEDEWQSLGKPAPKRQKMSSDSDDDVNMDTSPTFAYDANRNAQLKGRRRFNADLSDIQEASLCGLVFSGLKLQKIQAGEDEGSVEIAIGKASEHILAANLLISDTSEYPKNHSLFCYSPDGDLSARLQRIVDEIAEEPPRPLGDTIAEIMASVARVIGNSAPKVQSANSSDASDEEMSDNEGYDAFDDYDGAATDDVEHHSILGKLQEDFVDIVATEYRPGFIGIGGNDFVISVSLPVITLANSIPPRALMAWDRRLLASSQHLTLLIGGFHGVYPVLEHDASYTSPAQRLGVSLSFKVGLSEKYKPGNENVKDIIRKHGLILQDAEDELRIQAELAAQRAKMGDCDSDYDEDEQLQAETAVQAEEEEVPDPGRFDRFSLSNSLESLMDQSFLKIIYLRRKFGLGWAGAELLNSEIEKSQRKDDEIVALMENELRQADRDERLLGRTTVLPHDPLVGLSTTQSFNLPLTAFCYLIRRLSLCTRYCIVCHNKLQSDYEALKPYVCDSKLCSYQYYSMNRGPSLEYEIIHNPKTVDLLVSLAYVSANDGAMEDPLPVGLGLRVPYPTHVVPQAQQPNIGMHHSIQATQTVVEPQTPKDVVKGPDGLCDFDDLSLPQMRAAIGSLIHTLPSIAEMKKHLERKVKAGKYKPKLKDIDPNILPAAWSILRWCVASCTAHIEAIESGEELIGGLDTQWTQFRLTVGAPDAEAKFKAALEDAAKEDKNAAVYPVIYAFHGSPLRNWHSIIRHGLWYKVVTHGRAFGDGVYLAKDSQTSMGYYASSARSSWSKSMSIPTNCMALTEVVNLPAKFVSHNPHYVIKDTHWIMCRYLLVRGGGDTEPTPENPAKKTKVAKPKVPFVSIDPKNPTTVSGKPIAIPDPSYTVEVLLQERKADNVYEDMDDEDLVIFSLDPSKPAKSASTFDHPDLDDDGDYQISAVASSSKANGSIQKPKDDWKHDAEYVSSVIETLNFPPLQSSPSASMAIQRELRAMQKEQDNAKSLKELGWYMPPEHIGDNLYQWIVELHSLDESLPISKDMKANGVNSIIFEIRFPPTFPNSPPFFRIVTPRFLPFIRGGGGHVTGGGSICMDLLTSDGWLPSYSISAVLMQIRLALSNLEPRPARLDDNWKSHYGVAESLQGYKRAASTHNWTLPEGLDRLVR
ncbi:hypothetical protein BDN70DRAFT_876298 [Pholiota conissans]|uniref:UBC core domain-containing protein n=1 Tax=Pholiota conissans TaxID=109636 RepID=A0A9P5Z7C0_9AGAR|nr:hypothetical protein BDN70DRAFT_876298 [Pholiota conissans]